MDEKQMYPCDFEEFIRAVGVQDAVIESLREAWNERNPVDAYVHQKMMQLVNLYLLVGGMPAAVQTYLDTNDMQRVLMEQRSILALYKKDTEIIPLEVKSGKDYARHVALNNVMKNPEYGIKEAIVLCNDNMSTRGNVTYAPIYMLMFIAKLKDDGPKIFKLDLSGLV